MPRLRKLRRLAARSLPVATRDQVRKVASRSTDWAEAYERLLAAAEGRAPSKAPTTVPSPDPAEKVRKRVAQQTPERLLLDLRRGVGLDAASVRAVRSLLREKKGAEAQALADSLVQDPSTESAGHLVAAVVAASRGFQPLALHHFDAAAVASVLELAPIEYVHALFSVEPARGVDAARQWLADDPGFGARSWFEVYRQLFVVDELRLSDEAFAKVEELYAAPGERSRWKSGQDDIDWDRRWVGSEKDRTAPAPQEGRISFGLVDYPQPGRARASQNIGDQVQTLASLGHVVRHQNLRFHGDEDVVSFVEAMQQRVRPELRRQEVSADVELLTVDRDSSTYQSFPENTWLLEFGWHMHALFGLDSYDFPLHPNLNPIFVSFHCNKRGLLTPESLQYLRDHGPIGCRDWTTVDLLLSLDVPAFFSGCLTTTVNTVFPDLEQKPDPATVYVDVSRSPVPAGHENVKQSYGEIKKRSFTENMWDAVQVLERYRTQYTHVVTTRLHCYLPTTSLGLSVDFEPKNNADVRFNGLFRLDQRDFDAMRSSMRDRLEPVLAAIFSGQDRESVYALWRETVAPEVEAARARHEATVEEVVDHGATAAALLSGLPARSISGPDDAVDVVLTPTSGQLRHLEPVLRSAVAASSRPVRAWILARAARPSSLAVAGAHIHWIDTSGIDRQRAGVLDDLSLDRVLISELVPVDRAVLIPVDGVVTGDLVELAETDLGTARIAARRTSRAESSGFAVLYGAARRLDDAPDTAYEFYRIIHGRHVFDFDGFDTDVAVLDLAGQRAEGFADTVLPAMRTYRLNEREAWHFAAGPDRAELDPAWAHVPPREVVKDPKLWHWAEGTKPWSADTVLGDRIWKQYRSA